MSGLLNSLKSLAGGAGPSANNSVEDARLRFSAMPHPGDSGFAQWHDAMKMVARLPGGIPPDFRRRLWLTLAEKHLEKRRVEWRLAERSCFNEWTNPDDEDLGVQIVKDLHRTGCSLFCGAAAAQNQALLKRVLLGFARWNKSVGYCQGFNMLAALILQVVDRSDTDALKVMIYLIEGVLPESYFANNLRGLSVDMAVFRDLLRLRLPALSRHLEQLQLDAGDTTTGTSYEPPLTNVFTMQWFLTLFSNCLPQTTVLRVWDLVFLEGNGVLLRTALAIWETLQERIMAVESADEFYSIMGVLTREMLEFGLMDSNNLVKAVVRLPLPELCELRDRHLYDISPWSRPAGMARRLRLFHADDTDDDTDDDDAKLAVAATYGLFRQTRRRGSTSTSISPLAFSPERDRLASLDISALKEQYTKIRQRQRQAHIILSAACARQPLNVAPAGQVAMNHLLLGKSALMSVRGRRGAPPGSVPPPVVRGRGRREKELRPQPQAKHGHLVTSHSRVTCPQPSSGETLHWKDASSRKPPNALPPSPSQPPPPPADDAVDASDSSSTSTELCDEPDRLSDFDSEPTSLVIDDDDAVSEDAVKECVEVKEEIEKKVRELFRDFSKEDDDDVGVEKVDALVDLREVDGVQDGACLSPVVDAGSTATVPDLFKESPTEAVASSDSFMDFNDDGVRPDLAAVAVASLDELEPSHSLQDGPLDDVEPFDAIFDIKINCDLDTDVVEPVKSPDACQTTLSLHDNVDSLVDLKDERADSREDPEPVSPADISPSSRDVLEHDVCETLLDLKDHSVRDSPEVGPVSPDDMLKTRSVSEELLDRVAEETADEKATIETAAMDENLLDFTKAEMPRKEITALQFLELELEQLVVENVAPASEQLSNVLSPLVASADNVGVKTPAKEQSSPIEDVAFNSILDAEDDVGYESVPSALAICRMDLTHVPSSPRLTDHNLLCDSTTPHDAAAAEAVWQDADDDDGLREDSFDEFVSGRSKSPTLRDADDAKDTLKELVSKLALDLGGSGDAEVDVIRRSDIDSVRAKQLEPSTPFYKPKDARELFTIVDTPDEDVRPARPVERAAASPEDKEVYRKFVFPVVVPSPDEEVTATRLTDNGDDKQDQLPCVYGDDHDAGEEDDYFGATPLEVLPLDVLPVGASINLGRRKSERALQLISENSEILSQLTKERRGGGGGEDASPSSRRRLTAAKCPSFDVVGTERVTKIAGFKFHSYSVDGMSSERGADDGGETDGGKVSPERGAFDPFPVKRRPKQLGVYSPT